MLNPLFSTIVYLTEMLISYLFFCNIGNRRFSIFKCLVIGCLLFGTGSAMNLLGGNHAGVNTVVTIIMNISFAYICFDINLYLGAFYTCILIVIGGALEFVAISSISALSGSHFYDYNENANLFILECSISKILYFTAVFLLAKTVQSKKRTNTLPFNLLLYPVVAIGCFMIFWFTCAYPKTSYQIQSLLAIASIVLLLATILLFITYQHQVEKDRHAMQMQAELARLESEKAYYDILEQQNEDLMAYAHDAKNHLAAIKSLNNDPQIEGYLSSLSKQLADYTRNCHSGNKMLDVMIHKFCVECEMRCIRFDYDVKLCNLSHMDDIDLVAILGNLLDNAITAAESSVSKFVSLATARRNGYCVLVVSNSCDTPPQTRGNHLVSSKENTKHHGFGMKNVTKTLKKYQGDFEWEYDDTCHTFTVTAMLADAVESTANMTTP